MAGSLTWREYTADNGSIYSIKMDESNANAFGASGSSLVPIRTTNAPQLPRGVRKRYVLCVATNNPNLRRRFTVGSQATMTLLRAQPTQTITAADYPTAGAAGAGTANTWAITYYGGEKSRVPVDITAVDSGLNDGTVSQ